MLSRMRHESVYPREQQPRKALLWYAVVFTLVGLVLTIIIWLLVSAWKRPTRASLFERPSQTVASPPMQLGPLITGKDKATVGELVYLNRSLYIYRVAGSGDNMSSLRRS
jgi:hypothetical protein